MYTEHTYGTYICSGKICPTSERRRFRITGHAKAANAISGSATPLLARLLALMKYFTDSDGSLYSGQKAS